MYSTVTAEMQVRIPEAVEPGLAIVCSDVHAHELPPPVLDPPTAAAIAWVFQALSDPTRVRIISLLTKRELCVHTIVEALGMTQSAVSHQLRTLRDMRLVRSRKEGRHVYYTLDDAHVAELYAMGLAHTQHD
jgi:DNA-binding transcriptional ArsR family regulator